MGPRFMVYSHHYLNFENFILNGKTVQNLLVGLRETG